MMRFNECRIVGSGVSLFILLLLATLQLRQTGHAADDVVAEGSKPEAPADEQPYVPKTKAQLRKMLTPMQFKVTQAAGTEPAFRNAYWNNKRPGTYHCVVCDLPVFDSSAMFDSGTGWPSFYQPATPNAVGYQNDWHFVFRRIEVHCQRCKAHLGHVFDDGPPPTGKRYCMNSAALKFSERKTDAEPSGNETAGKNRN